MDRPDTAVRWETMTDDPAHTVDRAAHVRGTSYDGAARAQGDLVPGADL